MSDAQNWYIIRQQDSTCKIENAARPLTKTPEQKQWGAYDSEQEAIAKRAGLIRAGQCKPQ